MNKPTSMKGRGHLNKVQTTPINKVDGKKKDDDSSFIYNLGILIGCVAEIETKKGEKFEGILSAFTNQKIMIEAAHEPTGDDESSITKHYDLLIVPADKVSVIKFRNADLSYATRDFQTDSVISATRQLSMGDKELTPWEGDGEAEGLELDSNTNGWAPQEMFKVNETKYGVRTSFTEDLSGCGYTTSIDKTDIETLKKHEERAEKIRKEIENSPSSQERVEVELGDGDEEDAFSAVPREPNSPVINNHTPPNPVSTPPSSALPPSTASSKPYMPPNKRKSHEMQGHHPNHPNNNSPRDIPPTMPPRKPNPRDSRDGSYGPRSNGPPYGQPPRHAYIRGDVRRTYEGPPPLPRGQKGRMGRPRDDETKDLQGFGRNLNLHVGDSQRRPTNPNSQQRHSGPSGNVHMAPPPVVANVPLVGNTQNVRNPSPPGAKPAQISAPSPAKPKKEEFSPVPPHAQSSGQASVVNENSNSSGKTSPHATTKLSNAASASVSPSSSTSSVNPPSVEAVPNTSVSEGQAPAVTSNDSKSSSESETKLKKTFTFNPNAKEFNPNAKPFTPQRSPSTPPRPPSTPASAQQYMPAPAPPHPLMPLPVHPQIIYPYTTHAQAGLTHTPTSQGSSGGNTPRHRKGMVNAPSRPDMTPPMQVPTGPPLLPASLHAAAPPTQFYLQHPGGSYTQMMVPQGVVQLYQPDGSGNAQMHPQMHYLHNGGTPPANAGHQQATTPQSNPNAPTSNVPTNGHAYGQGGAGHGAPHHSYPYPIITNMVRVPYPPGPPHLIPAFQTVVHPGGGNSGIPHSQ